MSIAGMTCRLCIVACEFQALFASDAGWRWRIMTARHIAMPALSNFMLPRQHDPRAPWYNVSAKKDLRSE